MGGQKEQFGKCTQMVYVTQCLKDKENFTFLKTNGRFSSSSKVW